MLVHGHSHFFHRFLQPIKRLNSLKPFKTLVFPHFALWKNKEAQMLCNKVGICVTLWN